MKGIRLPRGAGRGAARSAALIAPDAVASLLRRPGHTLGMIAGITLGVAGAAAAVVIANTQQAEVALRFDLQRSTHVVVRSESLPVEGFARAQVDRVRELEPVSEAGEFSIWNDAVSVQRSFSSREPLSVPLLVADANGARASGTTSQSGASLDLLASARPQRWVWVGLTLARELGVSAVGPSDPGDSQIVIRGIPFSVAGVLRNDGGFGYVDRGVLVSRASAVENLGVAGTNVRFIAHVRPGSAAAVAAFSLRSLDPGGDLLLRDVTPPDGELLVASVGRDLRRFGAALSAFMGVIGMITISNTLLMSVYQRQRELGLRSAIGWSRLRIASLVLAESAIAGFAAGILGCGLGLAVSAAWCSLQGYALILPTFLPLTLIGGGVVASVAGGVLPALRAGSVSPLAAMRS